MIQSIVHEHIKITESLRILGAAEVNPFPGPHTLMPVQVLMSDVVIGTSGQTIKAIFQKTGCYVFVPRDEINGERIFQLSGSIDAVDRCKMEIFYTIQSVQQFAQKENR